MTAETKGFESLLASAASEFRSVRRAPMFPLVELARREGIEVWVRGTPSRKQTDAEIALAGKAAITLFRTGTQPGARRVAPEDENRLTARERFSIAHELGHWLLFKRGGHAPRPETDDGYTADEILCDGFANRLLLPDWLLDAWLDPVSGGESVPLALLGRWAASARISREVVAHGVVRRRPTLGFIKMSKMDDAAEPVFEVLFSAAGYEILVPGKGSHMRDRMVNGLVLKKPIGTAYLPACRLGERRRQNLALTWESGRRRVSRDPDGAPLLTAWLSLAKPCGDQMSLAL